ncbi:glutathione S-transferase family protein [Pseudomonas sp. EL_65y_Pfl2_R95]|uniref:glutathione S-transferase family protein n=1 Tax=Pseudomonas sp. EL_65y_Pfl2_R95 TaxID=3088698 RepID=UPI0030DA03D4
MLKLYGFAVSNYYNMVKFALLEKGMAFEEVSFHPDQSEKSLTISPRGKVPALGTEQGYMSETSVILEYLEETGSGKSLLPSDPFARAQVRALMREIELYIELPARLGYSQAFFGMQISPELKEKCRVELLAGVATLKRHGKFAPYVAGDSLTLADVYFLYSFDLACAVAAKLFEIDLLADFPAAGKLLAQLGTLAHVQQIAADKEANMPAFMAMIKARAQAGA